MFKSKEEVLAESAHYKVIVGNGRYQIVNKAFGVIEAEFARLTTTLEALPIIQKELDEYVESYKHKEQSD